jgi:hypothetical protein
MEQPEGTQEHGIHQKYLSHLVIESVQIGIIKVIINGWMFLL